MRKLLLAAGAWMALSTAAHAALTPTLDSVTASGSDWEWSYSASLSGHAGLVSGSELVIFDFAGYVVGSISAGIYAADMMAFTEDTSAGMIIPPGYDDDPLIPNLVFKWIGAPFEASGGPFADVTFAGLTAKSIFSDQTLDGFSAVGVINSGLATGHPKYDQGEVGVPLSSLITSGGGTPEPSTWAMMILGFGGVGALLRRRRQVLAQA